MTPRDRPRRPARPRTPAAGPHGAPLYRQMRSRSPEEEHRVATPLELFFDLCFVVAVSLASARLHHAIVAGGHGHGVANYLMVFFAIWWAWMNFTWFASAYDTDDVVYRLTTLVQIVGALVLAAGVPTAFDTGDFAVITYGYVIMRLALVSQWIRAARADPPRRTTALRFAAGVSVVQLGWLLRLLLPTGWNAASVLVLAVADVSVPVFAERAERTTWHPHHIMERYGLFTMIVLGETVLATTTATQSALHAGHDNTRLLVLAAAGVLIVFAMWWVYFDHPTLRLLGSLATSITWGYGHLVIFAAAAAVGAGLQVAIDHTTHGSAHSDEVSLHTAGLAIALPVAAYLLGVWLLRVLPRRCHPLNLAFPLTALVMLVLPFTGAPIPVFAVPPVALVATIVVVNHRAARRAGIHPAAGPT